ncbi:hypothetical protein ACOQH0_14385 [Enterobacter sp. JS8-1]|uniref:hypothetical protein n=1 Tax=Enterobacter sp. JS8-1 TaxID=3411633 RepID=UPI003BA06164
MMKSKAIYGLCAALALGGCAERATEKTAAIEPDFSVMNLQCSDESGENRLVRMYSKTETVMFDSTTYHFVEPTEPKHNPSQMMFSSAEGTLEFDMGKQGYIALAQKKGGKSQAFTCQNVK